MTINYLAIIYNNYTQNQLLIKLFLKNNLNIKFNYNLAASYR